MLALVWGQLAFLAVLFVALVIAELVKDDHPPPSREKATAWFDYRLDHHYSKTDLGPLPDAPVGDGSENHLAAPHEPADLKDEAVTARVAPHQPEV